MISNELHVSLRLPKVILGHILIDQELKKKKGIFVHLESILWKMI